MPNGLNLGSVTIAGDRQLDLDLDAGLVPLSGHVLWQGQSIAPSRDGTPALLLSFVPTDGGSHFAVGLPGDSSFDTMVPPGPHDVFFSFGRAAIPAGLDSNVPGLVRKGFDATTSPVLDLDVSPVTLSGTILLDGKVVPAGARWSLAVSGGPGGYRARKDFDGGSGNYSLALLPGGRVTLWFTSSCAVLSPGTPCLTSLVVGRDVAVETDTTHDIAVRTVELSGRAEWQGKPLGTFSLALRPAGSPTTEELSVALSAIQADYRVRVFEGTYGVSLIMPEQLEGFAGLARVGPTYFFVQQYNAVAKGCVPLLPNAESVRYPVARGLTLASDSALDLSPASVKLSGSVQVDGAVGTSYPWLELVDAASGQVVASPVKGGATYSSLVPPGTYDVFFRLNSPNQSARALVARATPVFGETILDVRVEARRWSGAATVGGLPLGSGVVELCAPNGSSGTATAVRNGKWETMAIGSTDLSAWLDVSVDRSAAKTDNELPWPGRQSSALCPEQP